VIAVALPAPDAWDASRPDTPEGAVFVRFIADSIVPEVERRFAASPRRADRWLLGFSGGANVMLDLAVRRPALFGRVAAQSPGWMFRDPATLQTIDQVFIDGAIRNVERATGEVLPAFWFTWGDAASEWESRSRVHGARMMQALRARGARVEQGALVPGDHGLHLLEQSLREALAFLWASARGDSAS
jgi:pimeloyl-ACP methyl ester carboxylesterase